MPFVYGQRMSEAHELAGRERGGRRKRGEEEVPILSTTNKSRTIVVLSTVSCELAATQTALRGARVCRTTKSLYYISNTGFTNISP